MQEWRGNDLIAEDFGWEEQSSRLVPCQGYSVFCPREIFADLKCSCKKGCSSASCSCVKNKFKCSLSCKCGIECQNHETEHSTCDRFEFLSSDSESDNEE